MNSYILLGIVAGLPLLVVLIFRVSAIFYFLSVAAGLLLAEYISSDTTLALNAFFPHKNIDSTVRLVLLLLPVLLTVFILRKTLSTTKLLLHLLPIVVTTAALATFIIDSLPGGVRHQLLTNNIGHAAHGARNVLITAATILTLILTWLTKRHTPDKKKHR